MAIILTIIFGIFFLILFPLGELARLDLPNNIAVTGVDIGVGLIFLVGAFNGIKRREKSFFLLKPILVFLGICALSLLVNISHVTQSEFFVSFLYLLRFAAYASLYFVVRGLHPRVKKNILFFMIVSGALILLGGYIQFFFYPSLRNLYYLGWDVHLYRMFSSFLDPNFFGAFLVLYLLFLLSFVCSNHLNDTISLRIGLLMLAAGTLIAIVLTYSRSAYMMCLVGVITFFIFQKPSKKIIYTTMICFVIAVVSYFGFTKYSEGTNLLRINSSRARITTTENAYVIFQKNPLLGVGFNAYRYAQHRYGFIQQDTKTVRIDHGGAGADNSFLFVLATTGVLGFLAYVYLLGKICLLGRQHQKKTRVASVIIASVVALCVDSLFINSLFYPFIMIWMWTLFGLGEGVDKTS